MPLISNKVTGWKGVSRGSCLLNSFIEFGYRNGKLKWPLVKENRKQKTVEVVERPVRSEYKLRMLIETISRANEDRTNKSKLFQRFNVE